MPNPFYYGGHIKDPSQFVGRTWELQRIFSLLDTARIGQLQSISIVGPRRIGRSSLLYHLRQVYPEHLVAPDRYLIAFLDLESGRYATLSGLLGGIVQELLRGEQLNQEEEAQPIRELLQRDSNEGQITIPLFTRAVEALGYLSGPRYWPVVCLDEFEQWVEDEYHEQFPVRLYDCWRALISDSQIAFVTASQRPLNELAAQKKLTSEFFNVFTIVPLGDFTDTEAQKLVNRGRTCDQPFSDADCRAVLQMAGRHPYKLQLAGSLVYQAKVGRQPVDLEAVQQQYEHQIDFIFDRRPAHWRAILKWAWCGLRWLVLSPRYVGRVARIIGFGQDDLWNWIIGVVVLVLIGLALSGVIPLDVVKNSLKRIWLFGISRGKAIYGSTPIKQTYDSLQGPDKGVEIEW